MPLYPATLVDSLTLDREIQSPSATPTTDNDRFRIHIIVPARRFVIGLNQPAFVVLILPPNNFGMAIPTMKDLLPTSAFLGAVVSPVTLATVLAKFTGTITSTLFYRGKERVRSSSLGSKLKNPTDNKNKDKQPIPDEKPVLTHFLPRKQEGQQQRARGQNHHNP